MWPEELQIKSVIATFAFNSYFTKCFDFWVAVCWVTENHPTCKNNLLINSSWFERLAKLTNQIVSVDSTLFLKLSFFLVFMLFLFVDLLAIFFCFGSTRLRMSPTVRQFFWHTLCTEYHVLLYNWVWIFEACPWSYSIQTERMSSMKTLDFNLKISHTTLQDKNKKKLLLRVVKP